MFVSVLYRIHGTAYGFITFCVWSSWFRFRYRHSISSFFFFLPHRSTDSQIRFISICTTVYWSQTSCIVYGRPFEIEHRSKWNKSSAELMWKCLDAVCGVLCGVLSNILLEPKSYSPLSIILICKAYGKRLCLMRDRDESALLTSDSMGSYCICMPHARSPPLFFSLALLFFSLGLYHIHQSFSIKNL